MKINLNRKRNTFSKLLFDKQNRFSRRNRLLAGVEINLILSNPSALWFLYFEKQYFFRYIEFLQTIVLFCLKSLQFFV